jgi:transposase
MVMQPPPESVTLTLAEGAALLDRVYASDLPCAACTVVAQIIRLHFWLLLAIQEAKLSLKRFRTMLFGEPAKSREPLASDAPSDVPESLVAAPSPTSASHPAPPVKRSRGGHRPGQGQLGAEASVGATRTQCRHEELAPGERCPLCGQGRLYRLPPGVEIRIDGHALLSAMRYEVEKLRCSACGAVCTAPLPAEASEETYSPRARAVLAVGR